MLDFYFDEHISRPVVDGLIRRDYKVMMEIDAEFADQHTPEQTSGQVFWLK